ncbi:hypothetical protein BN133_3758 [Cronobacter dublinensis 582]|nr:hypothetical protein BN133_3758 [Cronobacter dublinensis 582]
MQNGMRDHAVIHHHHDAARDADNQRHAEQIPRAVDKRAGEGLFAHTRHHAGNNGGREEHAGNLAHPPAAHRHAVNHHRERGGENHQNNFTRDGKRDAVAGAVAEKMRAVGLHQIRHERRGRILAHAPGVAHHPQHADNPAYHQQRHAQSDPAGERNACGVGGDHRRERIDGGAERADACAKQHGGGGHQRVEARGHHHRHQQGVKRQRLFRHAVDGAACGKQRHQNRDHPLFFTAQPLRDALDPGVDSAGFIHHAEKAADDQHKQRHVDSACGVGDVVVKAIHRCQQHGGNALRVRVDGGVSARDRHLFAERVVHRHLVLPGGHHPGQRRHQRDKHK